MTHHKACGRCLCGDVTFEVTLSNKDVHICHCELCQKWAGGPGLSVHCQDDWVIKDQDKVTWYDSSEWAQRGFCARCGTHLFFRLNDGSYHGVCAAALDSQEGFSIGMHIFIDKKPPYYDFTDQSPRLTKEEFLQMVGASQA